MPSSYPSADQRSALFAISAAGDAVRAFARPAVPAPRWWAELLPRLSPTAAQAYNGTNPANIPTHRVLGAGRLLDDAGTPYLARVAVPTDAGPYTVLLSRAGQNQPWLVERFTPPAAAGR